MKFSILTLSSLLCASTAFAAPYSRSTLESRLARRAAARQGTPIKILATPTEHLEELAALRNASHVEYSSNWSGAVLESPPAGATFTAVSATFVVPTPKKPTSGSSSKSYSASAWVGIDGDTYGNAILQTGVDFTVQNGVVSYDAWYEWYPDYAYDFSGITFSAGDTVSLSVVSSSSTKGVATITNVTKGKTVTKSLSAPSTSAKLGGQNAEWIVEDFEENGALVPLVNFGTVVFSKAIAKTSSGATVDTTGATIIDMKSGSTVETTVTASGQTVTVKYTGP